MHQTRASQLCILQIAVPCPLYGLFDYLLPTHLAGHPVSPGMRVLVPFGRQRLTGIIIGQSEVSDCPADKLKAILSLPDDKPVLPKRSLDLLKWAARYYMHPVGEAIQAALPTYLRQCNNSFQQKKGEEIWCRAGADNRSGEEVSKICEGVLKRAPKQQQVYRFIAEQTQGKTRQQLDDRINNWQGAVKALLEKSLIEKSYLPYSWQTPSTGTVDQPPTLHEEQEKAIEAIKASFPDNNTDSNTQPDSATEAIIHCLFGITGSGKTEVYLALSEYVLKQGKQVLILVPEISLTPQLTERFSRRLGTGVATLHSGLNESQRYAAWYAASSGDARIIIGTRSSVFTPLPEPGLIIVDEEHDGSYKQQDGFRYNARDLAVVLARQTGCPAVLGSATPSLETLNNINEQRYYVHYLRQRANTKALPSVQLLNLCNQKLHEGLSEQLLTKIEQHLSPTEGSPGQVLLFINRRGFAPLLMCHHCGWTTKCHRCDANMTYHKHRHQLHCHHCDSQRPAPEQCDECGSSEVIAIGSGTERIENYLVQRFSETSVSRIDRDTTRKKGALQEKLTQAHSGESGILVGTQMLAKGHDFPNLTLVAILDTDQALHSTDFRAPEHLAQLITQVSGRAGRAAKTGEVLIQTHHPEHPLLQTLLHASYEKFATEALAERKSVGLPPAQHLILIRSEAVAANDAEDFLSEVVDLIKHNSPHVNTTDIDIFGPVCAPMERRAGRYRYQLMLQSKHRPPLHRLLSVCLPALHKLKTSRRARWSIDVDPYDTF